MQNVDRNEKRRARAAYDRLVKTIGNFPAERMGNQLLDWLFDQSKSNLPEVEKAVRAGIVLFPKHAAQLNNLRVKVAQPFDKDFLEAWRTKLNAPCPTCCFCYQYVAVRDPRKTIVDESKNSVIYHNPCEAETKRGMRITEVIHSLLPPSSVVRRSQAVTA